ncbi:MAG: Uma2 family endonuclease [Limnothrix sp. CACIAM 69d]|nr:MAG: Uma2 family endonuclease [Limnothrix sp. CACIAM 69d]
MTPSTPIEPVAPPQPIDYPDSDGQPMADNTKQFQWIQILQSNLAAIFAQDSQVFVAGDLLWYPVEGNNTLRQAPDVMVVFGVPKGDRGSYQQWRENNIAPQVVFEILSPGNRFGEMVKKQAFYDTYGVEEYYVYDPDRNDLSIWLRFEQGSLQPVFENTASWVSPRLGVRFQLTEETLMLFRPDGLLFSTLLAELQRAEQAEQRAMEAEKRAEQAEQQLDRLAARLRALGIDPDAIEP